MQKNQALTLFSLSTIMAVRMLGLFMILPIFALAATQFPSATPTLIGVTLGIYGLSQAICQAPLGILSDYIGRKPVITLGLIIFILGSVIAAFSTDIYGILIGRALQGAGAIGAVILALVADNTQDKYRTQAMAILGFTIGISFGIAFIIGPIIYATFHLQGIFWLCALLGICGIILLYTAVPSLTQTHKPQQPKQIKKILHNPQLLRLNFGIFALHAILTALFITIPIILTREIKLPQAQQVFFYVAVLFTAFLIAICWIRWAEKKQVMRKSFSFNILILTASSLTLLFLSSSLIGTALILLSFFTAFTFSGSHFTFVDFKNSTA